MTEDSKDGLGCKQQQQVNTRFFAAPDLCRGILREEFVADFS
jgi:hypothetical protein